MSNESSNSTTPKCVLCGHDKKHFRVNEDPRAIGSGDDIEPRCWQEDADGFCGCRCEFPNSSAAGIPAEQPWKLFEGATVKHLCGRVFLMTVVGRDDYDPNKPVFVTQNGVGEPITFQGGTSEELRAMADFLDKPVGVPAEGEGQSTGFKCPGCSAPVIVARDEVTEFYYWKCTEGIRCRHAEGQLFSDAERALSPLQQGNPNTRTNPINTTLPAEDGQSAGHLEAKTIVEKHCRSIIGSDAVIVDDIAALYANIAALAQQVDKARARAGHVEESGEVCVSDCLACISPIDALIRDLDEARNLVFQRGREVTALYEAAKATLKYIENLEWDVPHEQMCPDCVGGVYYNPKTEKPETCWIHKLEKAVKGAK